jgi:hypothetical protein
MSDQENELSLWKKWGRPDGTSDKYYAKCEKWPPKRWAWEFLRRNPNFVLDTESVRGQTEAEQLAVANKYGLGRVKPASDRYRGVHGFPQFFGGIIKCWPNLEDASRKLSSTVGKNQMVILFDLEQMIADRASLRNQLDQAEKRLQKSLKELEIKNGKKAAAHKPKWEAMKFNLRLLDLVDVAQKTPLDCYVILDKTLAGKSKPDDKYLKEHVNSRYSSRIKEARAYSMEKYRYIANMRTRKSADVNKT